MNRPGTNSKLIIGFVLMLRWDYAILALALMCNIHELNQIQRRNDQTNRPTVGP